MSDVSLVDSNFKVHMIINDLMKKVLPKIPEEIRAKIDKGNITPTSFKNKNDVLSNTDLQKEAGYKS